ncbi:cyclic nucleotide-gated ion channel 1 isoform X2 [Pyrus x bretschneideri]|uniref:cyclic nucleotide-gated ion channel 1 isoform X2 n=1 Tax=Pyrus x bretschneideri TaxID=225117 RepID=UPI002030B3D6|nr:cyclic nucleotide-gated ion channel 1 isoform X2 [Pyrus x bretschneideri]
MAAPTVALDIENRTRGTESTAGSQNNRMGRQLTNYMRIDGGRSRSSTKTGKGATVKEILDPRGRFGVIWSKMFVISCAIAVSLDPFFFYIPVVVEEQKCIRKDTSLRTVALLLRSLTDMTFIIHILHEVRVTSTNTTAVAISILVDFLAILPIPQVYRIHLTSKKLKPKAGKWAKGAFNFFLYILASHITGAFWYFYSIQREISCWHRACMHHPTTPACMSTYLCDGTTPTTSRNISFLGEKCPTNPTNATLFDFGMFSSALESGTTQSMNIPPRIFYSFWWALRNLSSFGQNLQTSTYVWENGLAILICVMGLLLFLYLIGNVQTFIQLATMKSEEKRLDSVLSMKMQRKGVDIHMWMDKNGIRDKHMKTGIMKNIEQILKGNEDVDMEHLFSMLHWRVRKSIKHHLCMDTIKKVPLLHNLDEQVLQAVCGNLKQVRYAEDSFIVREGEPLDKMLFITQGIAWIYASSSSNTGGNGCLQKTDFYGEQLLSWALKSSSFSDIPISTRTVKSHTKVEAFALMAVDVKCVVSRLWWHFSKEMSNSEDPRPEQWELLAASSIQATWRRRHRRL